MQILKDCGLLEDRPVKLGSAEVAPRDLLTAMLDEQLRLAPEGDILVMRVLVRGSAESKALVHTFEMIDYFDAEKKRTAMARTTCYPAAYAARLIANHEITEKGVIFPERLFIGDRFDVLLDALAGRDIRIDRKTHCPDFQM